MNANIINVPRYQMWLDSNLDVRIFFTLIQQHLCGLLASCSSPASGMRDKRRLIIAAGVERSSNSEVSTQGL